MQLFENIRGIFESDSSLSLLLLKPSSFLLLLANFLLKSAQLRLISNLNTTAPLNIYLLNTPATNSITSQRVPIPYTVEALIELKCSESLNSQYFRSFCLEIASHGKSTTLSGSIFAITVFIDNRKKLLNSNISSICPHNMANFGQLTAEIGSGVWGTQLISTAFLSCLRYCIQQDFARIFVDLFWSQP